jgi:hypothetical protein
LPDHSESRVWARLRFDGRYVGGCAAADDGQDCAAYGHEGTDEQRCCSKRRGERGEHKRRDAAALDHAGLQNRGNPGWLLGIGSQPRREK